MMRIAKSPTSEPVFSRRLQIQMHSIAPILGVLLSTLTHSAVAGWFGPSTYEDCVLDALKTTKSAAGVEAVKQACWQKFKPKDEFRVLAPKYIPLTPTQLGRLNPQYRNLSPIEKLVDAEKYMPDTNFLLSVYNGNEGVSIKRMSIEVTTAAQGQAAVSRRYVGYGVGDPLSVGDFQFRIQEPCYQHCTVRVVGADQARYDE